VCDVVDGSEWSEDDDDLTGYVPPDQRWWRHPSELPVGPGQTGRRTPALLPAPTNSRGGVVLAAVIGTAGAVLVAYIVHLAHPATDDTATRSAIRIGTAATSLVAVTTAAPASSAVPGVVQLVVPAGSTRRSGSAAVVAEGQLVTSAKVVAGVTAVTAVMDDGSEQQANVVWVDSASGTAVLDIDEPTPTLAGGQAATLARGDQVTAAGTDTKGRVEAVGVEVKAEDGTTMAHLMRLRMDRPVSDGAVLLDHRGRAVGICIGHDRDDATSTLAAPIELARAAMDAAGPNGDRRLAWLGITGRTARATDLTPPTTSASTTTVAATTSTMAPVPSSLDAAINGSTTTAASIVTTAPATTEPEATESSTTTPATSATSAPSTQDDSRGAFVVSVEAGSPAAAAGVKPGDVVVAVDDVPVSSMNALVLLVRERKVGGTVRLTVERAGQTLEFEAVLQGHPAD
jgi:putative serine protease PepD